VSADGFSHLVADFIGVNPAHLRDAAMITGLLIAAASAAGFAAIGNPLVRQATDESVSAVLLLDDASRMSVQTMPATSVLLFDLLSPASHDGRKALDVFVRRLAAREVRSDQRPRG
jgi:S-adenosylmethionine/arginine decarboxylase-like enzyme